MLVIQEISYLILVNEVVFCILNIEFKLARYFFLGIVRTTGEVAEWLKAHAWNACIWETISRVRIPLSPPHFLRIIFSMSPEAVIAGNPR